MNLSLFGWNLGVSRRKGVASSIPNSGWIRETYAGAWQNGASPTMTTGELTRYGAVFSCISRIATDVSKLRGRILGKDSPDAVWAEQATSPWSPIFYKPNHYQTWLQFVSAWMVSKLLFGNTYVLKARDARGVVKQLHVLDARTVTPAVAPDGSVFYTIGKVEMAGLAGVTVPASEIIHDRGLCLWHPLVGVSPIYACAQSATQGVKIQSNSSKFFGNMSRPSGMLTSPGTIDNVTAERLKKEWEANYSNENIGRLAVAGDGLKYEPMTIPAEDAQLMQQLSWTVEDVARAFRVPLYKIGAAQVPQGGNVEAIEVQYYTGCLQEHIESLEACLDTGLELPNNRLVELDIDGLLRMDSATQIDMLTKAIGGALMKPDEARAKRNLPPVPGGDSVYLQQQNYSLEALARRDETAFTAPPPPPPAPPPADGSDTQDPPADGQDPPADTEDDVPDDVAAAMIATLRRSLELAGERV